jgi:predicted outer membrane repeat protein
VLEDRELLSSLTVTNNLDSGPGSLRAEIAAAQGGDTIHFAGKLTGQTITLTSGLLEINKNLTIQGLGAGGLAISGNGASSIFVVDPSGNVNLSGLTLEDGHSGGAAGAIANEIGGTMTISGCTITGNTAYGNGGGIWNGGTMTVSGSTITGNTSRALGGGISNIGTLTVSDCTITGNSAVQGGGIYGSDGSVAVSQGSTVCGNTSALGADDLYVYGGNYSISKNSDVCVIIGG